MRLRNGSGSCAPTLVGRAAAATNIAATTRDPES
jgi:hypothetical protein